jgi:hypothetical protein
MRHEVIEGPRPINGRLWGEWVRAGNDRWEVVRRSWSVFVRNTDELIDLLNIPATNVVFSLQLMNDDQGAMPFWPQLDQRLHNQLAGAVGVVDHARRLLDYYASDFPTMVAEFQRRNESVPEMNEAAFSA